MSVKNCSLTEEELVLRRKGARERVRNWRDRNPDAGKKWYAINREAELARGKKRRRENPEQMKALAKASYERNKVGIQARRKAKIEANKEDHLEYERNRRRMWVELNQSKIDALRAFFMEQAGGECVLCGYDGSWAALDYHHVDPGSKDFGIGPMFGKYRGASKILDVALNEHRGKLFDKIKNEIDKCIVLCAVCHRVWHNEHGA